MDPHHTTLYARVADDLPCRDLSHCTEFYIAVGVFTFYIGLYIGLYIVNFTFTVNFHVNVNVKPFGDFTCKSRTLVCCESEMCVETYVFSF